MTVKERADKAAKELTRQYLDSGAVVINLGEYEKAHAAFLAAMTAAVLEEREACAVVCESVFAENRRMGLTLRSSSDEASAIRTRHLWEE